MKPIRDYNDGQWLLLLWAFIVVFLVTGVAISTPVLVVSILAALGAAYTTYLYVQERIGRSPSGSVFSRRTPATGFGTPRAANPQTTNPQTTNPQTTNPQTTNHQTANPQTGDAEPHRRDLGDRSEGGNA